MRDAIGWLLLLLALRVASPAHAQETVAEKSGYKATARHAEVVAFCDALAKKHRVVTRGSLGTSGEGRDLPLLILSDPPVTRPDDVGKRSVAFAFGNIHAGEVCGKEALLMLAREIATEASGGKRERHVLLDDLVIVFAPIYNADGNERVSKDQRRNQVGPEEGMGQRENAQGLDLNRDTIKLASPEARALVRFYRRWNPLLVVDTHTTNGSHHGYTLTYASPRHPNGDGRLIEYVRDTMLPAVSKSMEDKTGYKSFFYGNFDERKTAWRMYPALPRYGTVYGGMRNRIAILSEAYAYAPYKDRVLATKAFVRHLLAYTAGHTGPLGKLVREARAGKRIVLASRPTVLGGKVTVPGDIEGEAFAVDFYGREEATLSVERPYAYLLPPGHAAVVETLQRHGVVIEELREDIELSVEVYRIDSVSRAKRPFQEHNLVGLKVTPRSENRRIPAGWLLVPASDAFAAYLLEPQAADGLTAWNFFDDALAPGTDFPVLRLPRRIEITRSRIRALEEDRRKRRRVTDKDTPNLNGAPAGGLAWLDDERFLQRKGGRLHVVHAESGRLEPVPDEAMATALSKLPTIDDAAARRLVRAARWDEARTIALLQHEDDLYVCRADGTGAARLTATPEPERFSTFSPDGGFVAYVRQDALHVLDLATRTERKLATGGAFDWVYREELYGHRTPAYWWSPDSRRIAFVAVDDAPVHRFTVLDQIPVRQKVESTAYPKAGDPNPSVRLGVVPVAGGAVRAVDLGRYGESSYLLTRVGWKPGGEELWFFVQDRAQTWLDFCTVPAAGGVPRVLFRETTGAWVRNNGLPVWLDDGAFLFPSERSGWRHLYRYAPDGTLKGPVTSGEWEVRGVERRGNTLFLTGTGDGHTQLHLYRCGLDGSGLARLTAKGGVHGTDVSPGGTYFLDTWSGPKTPSRVALFSAADGTPVRMLDTNPVHALDDYELGSYERLQIETKDGFLLEASLLKPPGFDPAKKYPVWFTTYGGPHAPTVRDGWRRSAFDELLAAWGIVVFRADPRSASGKGAVSAWAAYKRLGESELADIAEAIGWLKRHAWVDGARIGMSGHSYGGFMTAYAMTHSKLFCAGIAGSPVTDWRFYDTIYTERYMDTPQANPEGYAKTSVVEAAGDLHGRLLLVHGAMDDNVHFQNTLQLAHALQRAGKPFELMVYPKSRHGIGGEHYRRLRMDFIRRVLGVR